MSVSLEWAIAKIRHQFPLPKKFGEFVLLSLKDLELCEKNDKYHIEMADWYKRNSEGSCGVCQGGAVLAIIGFSL